MRKFDQFRETSHRRGRRGPRKTGLVRCKWSKRNEHVNLISLHFGGARFSNIREHGLVLSPEKLSKRIRISVAIRGSQVFFDRLFLPLLITNEFAQLWHLVRVKIKIVEGIVTSRPTSIRTEGRSWLQFFPLSPSAVVQGAINPLAYWRSAQVG